MRQIIGIVVAVVLLAVGGFAWWSNYQKSQALQAGNCVVLSGSNTDIETKVVDCSDKDTFSYEVGKVVNTEGSCGEQYDEISLTKSDDKSSNPEKVGCLLPNFRAGSCYDASADVMGLQPVDCPGGSFKVSSVEDSADATCAEGEQPFSIPEPARTFCLAEPA